MIKYAIAYSTLEALINKHLPKWIGQAKKRTEALKKLGKFADGSPDWGKVKPYFMMLQGENKCIYCERKIGSVEKSLVEQDLEHFRPKGNVDAWAVPPSVTNLGIKVTKPTKGKGGYFLLAYHLDNYSASCKTCNSTYKGDRFPIAGKYSLMGTDPRKLTNERALLIYPFGDQDNDPETLISFNGYLPYAVPGKGFDTERAIVTIAFFGLDSVAQRSDLFLDRAWRIIILWDQLERSNDNRLTSTERAQAAKLVTLSLSPNFEHTNCARSFKRLYDADRPKAEKYFKEAYAYVESKAGAGP